MSNKFWNIMANSYDKNVEKVYSSANKKIIEASKEYCQKNMSLLDIGCGTGMFTIELAKYVASIDAIDCSSEMLKIAKEKSKSEKVSNVNWQCGDIVKVLPCNNKYNIITAFNVLLYLPDHKQLLSNIYDFLDDSGYFLSVTDCLGENTGLFKKLELILSKFGILPKIHAFKTRELEKLIENAGFEILFAENFHYSHPNYFIVAKKKKQ
jgi:ubiquinone/menaquinone biosynthesis C-methylase UbiE